MDAEKIGRMLRMLGPGVSRRDFIRTTAVGAAGTLAAPRAVRAQGTPKKGGTLVYGMEGPSDILDPQATGCWLTYRVTFQMFEGLLAEDLTKADVAVPPLIPRLAESWQVGKDGLTRTFKLRKGVKFHDGTPFNAQAAVFSWERMFKKDAPHFYPRANSYTSYVVEYVTGAEAVDEYTLKLTFSKPYAEGERMTLQSWGEPMMVSPTQVKKLGNEKFANGPVGTGPFKVDRVRKAGERAVEKEKMCKDLPRGTAKPAWSMVPPATIAYDPKYKPYSYNPERAKQFLKEAGHANGFETVFWTSTSGSGQMIPVAMAEWIQRDLAKVGIRVKLETFDWITYLSKMFQRLRPGHGAYQLSWGMTTNFWIDIVARSTRQPDKGVNVGWYANPRVDALLDTARGELDESKRVAIYRQIDRILMEEDASFLPICNDLNLVVLNPKGKGFVNPPEEWFQLWTPWVEA